MENNIAFTVKGGDRLHFLSAGRTLINFIEYDISPFYKECQALAKSAAGSREFDERGELMVKDLLRGCHPYFAACYNGVFDKIVLDCVIDILCRMDGIGLEAMWARNISAEDSLGKAVFQRISDYKTGRAVNQWANLQRMQKYAQKKAGFVFGTVAEDPVQYDVRTMYFDLAFSTGAKLAGFSREDAPAICCTPTGLLSAAPEILGSASAMAASMLGEMPNLGGGTQTMTDCVRELNDGIICAELMSLPLPDRLEMISVAKKLREIPRRTYVPQSFKAAIDLEFDELLERKLILEPSPETGRFELRQMYRPAPPVFDLRPTEEYAGELSAKQEKPPESAEDAEEISEIQPEQLYKAIEPEPEPELEPEQEPEVLPEPEQEPKTEPTNESQPEPEVVQEPEPKPEPETEPVLQKEIKPKAKSRPQEINLTEPGTEEPDPRRETEEQNRVAVSASKMEVKRIAAPVAEIAMLTDDSYGRKPRRDRRALPMEVPETAEERMQLLQRLAADKRRSVRRHEGQDVDVFCQSVHTALSAELRDEKSRGEEEKWAKLLFRIRGGVMTRRYSTEYLYRFLDATVEMYRLEV